MQRWVLFAAVLAVGNSRNMRFRAIHYRHCLFLRYFFQQLFTGYSAPFQMFDGRLPSLPLQGAILASSGVGTTLQNNPLNDTQISVSKPTPFNADQRYSRLQRDGLVSRREKPMIHLQEDMQQLRRCSSGTESLGFGKKWNGDDIEEDCKSCLITKCISSFSDWSELTQYI